MTNNKKKPEFDFSEFDWGWLFQGILINGAFILGALLMYSKTADLLTKFAPSQMFGYVGIESYYGAACALIIEGLFVAAKFSIGRSSNPISWVWNLLLTFVPFLISAFAQVADSFVNQDTLSQQPAEIQVAVYWGVPLLPALVVALVLAKSVFDSLPPNVLMRLKRKSVNTVDSNPKA